MISQLRFLLTLFTILCCTTIAGATVQQVHTEVVFEKACVLDGETGFLADFNAPKSLTRSLDDFDSLRGANPREIENLIPGNWVSKPLKKGEGTRYLNPDKSGEAIMIEKSRKAGLEQKILCIRVLTSELVGMARSHGYL